MAHQPKTDGQAGSVSPLLLILLVLLVALFVFGALAGARGGLSAGGCLPTDQAGRQDLGARWFPPTALAAADLQLSGCAPLGQVLVLGPQCQVVVPAVGKDPTTLWERMTAAFHDRSRRLTLRAEAALKVTVHQGGNVPDIDAKLKAGAETSVTVSRTGATLQLACDGAPRCQVVISKPAEAP